MNILKLKYQMNLIFNFKINPSFPKINLNLLIILLVMNPLILFSVSPVPSEGNPC